MKEKKNPKRETEQKAMSLMAFEMTNITLKRKGGGEN